MPDNMQQPEPWDRESGESNRWFSRFERYRLTGSNRSLLGTVNAELTEKGRKKQTKVPGAWNRAFERWRWRERAEAWDELERQKARETHAKEINEMNHRHIQESQVFQNKGIQRMKSTEPNELSPTDALRFVMEATKLERTARGEPETIEERRLTGKGGGAVIFSLEDAVTADQELEKWEHDRLQQAGGEVLPDGNPQVP
jgi:hypothetical protein